MENKLNRKRVNRAGRRRMKANLPSSIMRYDGPEPYLSEPITTYSSVQDLLSFDNVCDREKNTA